MLRHGITRACARLAIVGLTAAILSSVGRVAAQTATEAPAQAVASTTVDPTAEQVLRKAADYYQSLKGATADVATRTSLKARGMRQETETFYTLAFERPNKLAVKSTDRGMDTGSAVSDGAKMWVHLPMMGQYSEGDAPTSLNEISENQFLSAVMQYAAVALMLVGDDPYAKLIEDTTSVRHSGQEQIDGVNCDKIEFDQRGSDATLWIEAGDRPVIRRLSPDMSAQMAAQRGMMPDMTLTVNVDFTDWKAQDAVAPSAFAFQPPEGAQKTQNFGMGGAGEGAQTAASDAGHPLVGQPAPAFDLKLADGGTVNLADHKGKDVVMLDFWATWCGPCVKGLPIVSKVAKDYADKGVVFYAVNVQESAEEINAFLQKHGLDIKVPMDAEGNVSTDYKATGIPQTVIIDKNGVVQVVHVGLLQDLETRLPEELQAVLDGKNLSAQPSHR